MQNVTKYMLFEHPTEIFQADFSLLKHCYFPYITSLWDEEKGTYSTETMISSGADAPSSTGKCAIGVLEVN